MSESLKSAGWRYDKMSVTYRGLEGNRSYNYLHYLDFGNKEEFLQWLKDKKTLDIGAGFGHLRKDLLENDLIHSDDFIALEPRLSTPEFKRKSLDLIAQEFHLDPEKDADEIERIEKEYRQGAVAADWRHMPFADNSFDNVLSYFAFPFWESSEENIRATLLEIKRILKNSGEVKLAPIEYVILKDRESGEHFTLNKFKEILKEMGFDITVKQTGNKDHLAYCLTLKNNKT